jgi:2-phospho-L-lactate guanylyltransferase
VTVVAVPVKDLVTAKQRLVGLLTPRERMDLARAMLRDVLRTLAAAHLEAVWVVTRDAEVTAIARAWGAAVLIETENRGHTAAVALAQTQAAEQRVQHFLTVPGDVPCVTAGEIAALAAAAEVTTPAAVFTPSRSGRGTNGVALAPPEVMPLTFGEPSFENHLAAARRQGLEPRVLALGGLGLDIDGPDDLAALLAEGGATETARLLSHWDLAARLQAAASSAAGSTAGVFERRLRRRNLGFRGGIGGGVSPPPMWSIRRLRRRNPVLGEASEGAVEAPSD